MMKKIQIFNPFLYIIWLTKKSFFSFILQTTVVICVKSVQFRKRVKNCPTDKNRLSEDKISAKLFFSKTQYGFKYSYPIIMIFI